MEMNRRTFLKTTAAAAVAVSLSGVLAGCSGGDSGTNLGGFTVKAIKWSAKQYDQGIGSVASWYADFTATVSVHNLDSENTIGIPGAAAFALTINGQNIELQSGGILSNTTLVLKKGERKTGVLTFRLDKAQRDLYNAMDAGTAEVKLTVGVRPQETYTGVYTYVSSGDGYAFVKDVTV